MARSRFEALALRFVPGDGPVELQSLESGLVNQSCRVARAGRAYSLRIAPARPDPGLDRRWECAVRGQAAAAGLAPAMHRCDAERGILVAEWATGRPWSAAEARLADNIELMAQLLRRVHSLPIPQPARCISPAAWIAGYRDSLSRDGAGPPPRSAALCRAGDVRLAGLAEPAAVLCHSDLHRLNLLIGEHPVLLDWEYAHVSDGLWDLAGWAANNDWTHLEAGLLLAAYARRRPSAAERERLATWMWLYDYVCLLWSELYLRRRTGAQAKTVAARAEVLATRLAQSAGHSPDGACCGGRDL